MTPWPKLKFKSDFIPPQHSMLLAWRLDVLESSLGQDGKPLGSEKSQNINDQRDHWPIVFGIVFYENFDCYVDLWPYECWRCVPNMRTPACHTPEKRLSGERTRRVKHEWKQEQVEPLGTMSQLWSRSVFEAALEDKLHCINVGSGVLMLSFATFWCTRINLAESCNRLHQATARGLDILYFIYFIHFKVPPCHLSEIGPVKHVQLHPFFDLWAKVIGCWYDWRLRLETSWTLPLILANCQ